MSEILVLRSLVDDCYRTLESSENPRYISEAMISCFKQGEELQDIVAWMGRFEEMTETYAGKARVTATMRFLTEEEILESTIATYRESVLLLRDLCSEVELHKELEDMGNIGVSMAQSTQAEVAGTAGHMYNLNSRVVEMSELSRRNTDTTNVDTGSKYSRSSSGYAGSIESDKEKRSSPLISQSNAMVRSHFEKQISDLAASNYTMNTTIVVENLDKAGGQRFEHVPANVDYHPGILKLDTGSEADLVSYEYLLDAGLKPEHLAFIPEEERTEVEGIAGAKYTPKYEINLKWCRQGELRVNKTHFLVVEQAPFELLLSSRRFAEEASRQLVSLPLVRPRKTRDVIKQELENEQQKLDQARALEQQELQAELVRRRTIGRVSTTRTTNGLVATNNSGEQV